MHVFLPECPKFTTVCNRNITCSETFVYKECKSFSLSNAKLVCNESLEWEQNFTCPSKRNLNTLSLFLSTLLSLLFFLFVAFLMVYNAGRIM